jgi:hypothetical protein
MNQLTNDELNYVVESLLFSLCLEITDRWSDEDREQMLRIATKLRNDNTTINNLDLNIIENQNSKLATEIVSLFPEININNIKEDYFSTLLD